MSKLQIRRGDTAVIRVAVTRRDPDTGLVTAVNLTGAKMWFTAKRAFKDADAGAVIQKGTTNTTLSGIEITNAALGFAEVTVDPDDTVDLAADTTWLYYDVQLKETDDRLSTVQSGPLVVSADVTRATT